MPEKKGLEKLTGHGIISRIIVTTRPDDRPLI
jgi:hypothetical protein